MNFDILTREVARQWHASLAKVFGSHATERGPQELQTIIYRRALSQFHVSQRTEGGRVVGMEMTHGCKQTTEGMGTNCNLWHSSLLQLQAQDSWTVEEVPYVNSRQVLLSSAQ